MLLSAKATLLQGAEHGTLVDEGGIYYRYDPKLGYLGTDRATFLVEMGSFKVKVVYHFQMISGGLDEKDGPGSYDDKKNCPNGIHWKISLNPDDPNAPIYSFEMPSQLTSAYAGLANVNLDFADLPGGAVGQTFGTNITLDDNASGHGWFVDPTPGDNSEYLPTSNPNEWQARAGTAAYGKMDMLSVLLHEYGHALGIAHSADPRDYMATTLTPGVRRMPSAEELALMQQLVAQAKGEVTASTLSPSLSLQGGGGQDVPFPTLPLGGGIGLSFLGFLRSSRFGGMSIAPDYSTLVTQYAVSANPTLTNPEFVDGSGWATQGSVAFGNGTATMTESAQAQTRLNQVFVLGEHDRFLRFTLADIALDDVNSAPDDAFEVALLDANTGLSLFGSNGLTRTDAFLNLQANGMERLSANVSSTGNADGSRTYLVDLSSIVGTAGFTSTTVNLSFDLIGFGRGGAATTSHLTVRDLKLGIPETHDDAATTAEDTPATIAALSNDLDANQPGFVPVVVTGPAHGTVTINADGTFGYTPDLNYFGSDSFTYKLSDSRVDSNPTSPSLSGKTGLSGA